jgi:hypothetical protein
MPAAASQSLNIVLGWAVHEGFDGPPQAAVVSL